MHLEEQRSNCPGYLDEYGIWNNGFECPSLAGQKRVCCGSDSRRYCCTLEYMQTTSINPLSIYEKPLSMTNQTNISLIEKINLTFLTLPVLITCIFIIILLLLFSLIVLSIFNRNNQQNRAQKEKFISTNHQTLFVDHFPFSPPHHQLVLKKSDCKAYLLKPNPKDTLTSNTTSSSPSSVRLQSDSYFDDWRQFFSTREQPMNLYPTVSTQSVNTVDHRSYLYSNYLLRGNHQLNDIVV